MSLRPPLIVVCLAHKISNNNEEVAIEKMSGSSIFTASAPKPNALYQFKDQDTVLLQVRAQRNF